MFVAGAEPFLLTGGRSGVLLVHGFTGSPAEMKLLGDHLHQQNYTVLGIRLCGHATDVADLNKTNWKDWYASVLDGYYLLKGLCDEINVVGLSLGGLLTLKLASNLPVNKIVTLSAPIFLYDKRLPFIHIYKMIRPYVKMPRKKYSVPAQYSLGYNKTPVKSLLSLLGLIEHLKTTELPKIKCPALIVQSTAEHTVQPHSAEFIFDNINSATKEIFWLQKSGHIVVLDNEREKVFAKVAEFLLDQ